MNISLEKWKNFFPCAIFCVFVSWSNLAPKVIQEHVRLQSFFFLYTSSHQVYYFKWVALLPSVLWLSHTNVLISLLFDYIYAFSTLDISHLSSIYTRGTNIIIHTDSRPSFMLFGHSHHRRRCRHRSNSTSGNGSTSIK